MSESTFNRQNSIRTRLMRLIAFWPLLTLFVGVASLSGRNLPSSLLCALAVCMGLYAIRHKRWLRSMCLLILLMFAFSVFLPIDVFRRRGPSFRVAILPVAYHLGSSDAVREMEDQGLIRDRDFLVVKRYTFTNRIRWGLVIFVP